MRAALVVISALLAGCASKPDPAIARMEERLGAIEERIAALENPPLIPFVTPSPIWPGAGKYPGKPQIIIPSLWPLEPKEGDCVLPLPTHTR